MFTIDFFELAFLAEVCVPPVPIARSMFWKNLTDKYFDQMTESERARMFEFLNRKDRFKKALEDNEEDVLCFYNRFNPDNQYEVEAANGKTYRTFLHNGKHHIYETTYIPEENIKSFKKLEIKH